MGILCVFCVYDTIGNRCFEKTSFPKTIIITSMKSETMGKLINRIPGSRLLISSLPGLALRMHVEWLGKPRDSTCILKALPGKLDIKRHSPSTLYLPAQLILRTCTK